MIEIKQDCEKSIRNFMENELGFYYDEFGAFIDDKEFILVYKNNKIYLAHISEFEQSGIFVRLKETK